MSADLSDAAGSPMIEGEGLSKVECLTDDDHTSIKDSSADEEYLSEIGGYIKHGSSPDDEDLSKVEEDLSEDDEEEDLSKVEEDLSEDDEEEDLPKFEEEPFDFGYISEPEDYSMFESPICRGQTRLFWNLEHYPISDSANLVSIHRNIKWEFMVSWKSLRMVVSNPTATNVTCTRPVFITCHRIKGVNCRLLVKFLSTLFVSHKDCIL